MPKRLLCCIFVTQNFENTTIMGIISSSIARKVAMALSGLFLVFFLGQHFTINLTSVIDPDTFNEWSHFMGTNILVQAVLQPILIFGVIFHFIMGFILEIRNRKAKGKLFIKLNLFFFKICLTRENPLECKPEEGTPKTISLFLIFFFC